MPSKLPSLPLPHLGCFHPLLPCRLATVAAQGHQSGAGNVVGDMKTFTNDLTTQIGSERTSKLMVEGLNSLKVAQQVLEMPCPFTLSLAILSSKAHSYIEGKEKN